MSSSSLIRFNTKEFHYYEQVLIYNNGVVMKATLYGYIGMLNSFILLKLITMRIIQELHATLHYIDIQLDSDLITDEERVKLEKQREGINLEILKMTQI